MRKISSVLAEEPSVFPPARPAPVRTLRAGVGVHAVSFRYLEPAATR
ncbi:MAG: hypothetical protein M0Z46_09085 [Actinomycetota bacterium]|jgi:hypothetical protein|nr:hypothetical protein [Actinomycetota bacterium]